MGNRRRNDVLDTMIDTIILTGPIKRTEIPKKTGIAIKTVNEWLEIIMKIQSIPPLVIEGEGRNQIVSVNAPLPEDARLDNAVAFFSQVVELNEIQEREKASEKPEV